MSAAEHFAAAFEAYQAGDPARARTILQGAGQALRTDPACLQLFAFVHENPHDSRALLQYAALELAIGDAGAHFNLAVADQELGFLDKALLRYRQTLRLDPGHLGALNNLSDLLRRRGHYEQAWEVIQDYLSRGGPSEGLEIRIAKIATDCGFAEQAVHWFGRARASEPERPDFAWEEAMLLLREECFEQGWEGYEARRAIYQHDVLGLVQYPLPEWRGDALQGRSLLLHKEQGLGDMIMFASLLGQIPADAGALHLAVQPPLARLFEHCFPGMTVWASASRSGEDTAAHQPWYPAAGPIDLQLPLASLARLAMRQLPDKPRAYLSAPQGDIDQWQARLAGLGCNSPGALKVGLVISARPDGARASGVADGTAKSVPAQAACGLASPTGVCWIGLHDRSTAATLADLVTLDVIDTSDWLLDLADTAGLIANLDLVVAVDTAVAHLAGAMGKKTLLMLRRHADWRWGSSRADSYWAPWRLGG